MHGRLATVLVATAIIAAGCGGGTDDADGSPTATPAAVAAASTTAATAPTTEATSAPAGVETSSTLPEPAPEPTANAIAGGIWSIPPGASAPDSFSPFTEGTLELSRAQATPGDAMAGTFSGVYGYALSPNGGDGPDGEGAGPGTALPDVGLVINEVAANRGDPWLR